MLMLLMTILFTFNNLKPLFIMLYLFLMIMNLSMIITNIISKKTFKDH